MSFAKRVVDLQRGKAMVAARLKEFGKQAPVEVLAQMDATAGEMSVSMRRMIGGDEKLRSSVGHGPEVPKGAGLSIKAKAGPMAIFLWAGSAAAFWARWREFGTQPHSLAQGASVKRGKKQDVGPHSPGEKAQPYFWPVWRAYKKIRNKDMRKAYREVAKRVFGNAK